MFPAFARLRHADRQLKRRAERDGWRSRAALIGGIENVFFRTVSLPSSTPVPLNGFAFEITRMRHRVTLASLLPRQL